MLIQEIQISNYYYQPAWILIIIVLSIMIIGFVFSAFQTRFVALLKDIVSFRSVSNEISISNPFSLLLIANYLLNASLFLVFILSSENVTFIHLDLELKNIFLISFIILSIMAIKTISTRLMGFIFEREKLSKEYVSFLLKYNQLLGIILFPNIVFLAYGSNKIENILIYSGLIFIATFFLLRVIRSSLSSIVEGQIKPLYLFLYICSLEILPLILGIKLMGVFI